LQVPGQPELSLSLSLSLSVSKNKEENQKIIILKYIDGIQVIYDDRRK
jgi:hypothetical protein